MKKMKFTICITLFSVAITLSQTTITNNPNTRYQAMKGWGTSVAWWGNIVGGMPQASIDEICYRIAVEANLNFFRFKIGGGDNPNCPAGDHLRKDGGQTPGYRPFYANNQGFGVVDVSKDYRQIAVMDKLASLRAPYGDMITEMFSCSPPYYMTNSFCTSGAVGAGENLAPGFEDDFADYLCSVTKTLRDTHPNWNIKDIAPFNEPYSNWWPAYGGQEGCKMLAPTQATVLWRTWQSQQTYGISDLGLVASDCNSIGEARQNAFDLWTNHRNEYNGISNIAVHSYFGTSQEKADLYTDIANTGKSIWQTETGPLSWFLPDGGQWWWRHYDIAQRLVDDIRNLKPEVWCIWQANGADDGWALVNQTNFDENDQYKTPTLRNTRSFYIMKQIASYIKVGYTQIANSDPNSMTFVSPDNKKVVVVISNYKTTPSAYSIDLSNFQPITYFDTYRTSGGDDSGENAKLLTSPTTTQKGVLSANRIAYTAPAMSVTTFVASLETPVNVSVNDFESVTPNNVVRYGSDLSIVANPTVNATNATTKTARLSRTTSNWYELFAFNIDPITVPANTTYYLHAMVKYDAATDIAIRFDATNRDNDGVTPIRPINPYTSSDAGQWKDLVFAIPGGTSGITVNAIQFHPDLGFENTPAVQVLNNSTSFGYIDELLISTSSTERTAVAAPTLASTLANFDGISPAVTTAFGATQAIVANPYPNGGNTSANVIRIGRTSTDWYEYTKLNIPDFALSAGETKYIHIAVNYPAMPVTSIRIDVDNTSSPAGVIDILPVNTYASASNSHWQDLVFAVSGGANGLAVNNLVLLADVGNFSAPPAGQVLNNTVNYAYIDNIVINSSATPLFTARTSLQAITLFATLNTNPTPRLIDYGNAGVIGVTADNLTSVNTAIESASPAPLTLEQVQAVVNQAIASLDSQSFSMNLFKLYPNPTSDSINIILESIEETNVEILNINGQRVLEYPKLTSKEIALNVKDILASGTYFVKVSTANKTQTQKMIVK